MFIVFDAALVGSTSGDDLIDAAQQISGSNNASSNKWPKRAFEKSFLNHAMSLISERGDSFRTG